MSPHITDTTTDGRPWALQNLPPFPWITTKVLQLFSAQSDEVEVKKLVDLIRADATLSSELIRRANSPLYGLRSQVSSLERAITMIGLGQVKSLAATLSMGTYLQKPLKVAVLRRCWRHTLACAMICEELAAGTEVRPDQAYTAGLLHDIGRLALLVNYPQSYADLLSVVLENQLSLVECECDLFEVDHCAAGEFLAAEWGFPADLLNVIARHHDAPDPSHGPVLRLVQAGCSMADCFGFSVTEPSEAWNWEQALQSLPKQAKRYGPYEIDQLRQKVTTKVNALE